MIDIVHLLVEAGTDINAKNKHGFNALMSICRYYPLANLKDLVEYFLNHGIEVNCTTTNSGWNALQSLCKNYAQENSCDIAKLLIERGIDLNAKNENGSDALLLLCEHYSHYAFMDRSFAFSSIMGQTSTVWITTDSTLSYFFAAVIFRQI